MRGAWKHHDPSPFRTLKPEDARSRGSGSGWVLKGDQLQGAQGLFSCPLYSTAVLLPTNLLLSPRPPLNKKTRLAQPNTT
jgi:hypothetical protein